MLLRIQFQCSQSNQTVRYAYKTNQLQKEFVCVFKCYIKLEIKRLDLNLFKNHDQYNTASSEGQGEARMR